MNASGIAYNTHSIKLPPNSIISVKYTINPAKLNIFNKILSNLKVIKAIISEEISGTIIHQYVVIINPSSIIFL